MDALKGSNKVTIGKTLAFTIIILGFSSLYFLKDLSPSFRFLCATFGMIFTIKVAALVWQVSEGARFQSLLGLFLFLFTWPGVLIAGFLKKNENPENQNHRFFEASLSFLLGAALLIGVSISAQGQSTLLNYVSLFAIFMIVQLGFVEMITDSLRWLGFSPPRIFDRPYLSTSLRDFWSLRWNRAFAEMSKMFILRPLKGKLPLTVLTLLVFGISGIIHELGISYTDGLSWGRPFTYFVIQGVGMKLEKVLKFSRFLVLPWVVAPVPLLFTPTFTNLIVGRFSENISNLFLGL